MKKIIFFFLGFIFFVNDVSAKYTEIYDPNKKIINTEYRYKWYQIEKNGDYYSNSNVLISIYNYTDENDYIYGDFSDYTNDYEEVDFEKYDSECKYKKIYKKIIDTRFIMIDDFSTEFISDIQINIYYDGELINNSFYHNAYWDGTYKSPTSRLVLILPKWYETNDKLSLKITFSEPVNIRYNITLFNDIELKKITLFKRVNSSDENFSFDDTWINKSIYTDKLSTEENISKSFNNIIYDDEQEKLCRFREKLFYRYNLDKKYYDNNYYTNIDNYIKDDLNYKIFYEYEENNKDEIFNNEDNFVNEKNNEIFIPSIINAEKKELLVKKDLVNKVYDTPKIKEASNKISNNKKKLSIKYSIFGGLLLITIIFIFVKRLKNVDENN